MTDDPTSLLMTDDPTSLMTDGPTSLMTDDPSGGPSGFAEHSQGLYVGDAGGGEGGNLGAYMCGAHGQRGQSPCLRKLMN